MNTLRTIIVTLAIAALSGAAVQAKPELTASEALRAAGIRAPAASGIVIAQVSMSCGIAPIPPLGCKVGPCVCDQNGQNCHWTFVCN